MKKVILGLLIFFLLTNNVMAENVAFLHPVFYQQLSSSTHDFFYILKPNKMYYENSKTLNTKSVKCILQDNQEYYIKMLCNDCTTLECSSYSQKFHIFYLFKDKMTDNNYIISHKVINKDNNIEFEETLINDGLITIPPYQ